MGDVTLFESSHYIFYPCRVRFEFVFIKITRPKSDRLSNEKEKSVKFLARQPIDYELKLQYFCELEKIIPKNILKSKESCEFAY